MNAQQALKKILVFLCSVPPESKLRLMLQLALAAEIPEDKRKVLFDRLQGDAPLENLLLDSDNVLMQMLEADGEIGDAEENMLFEAMNTIGSIVPNNFSSVNMLVQELSDELAKEIKEMDAKGTVKNTPLVW